MVLSFGVLVSGKDVCGEICDEVMYCICVVIVDGKVVKFVIVNILVSGLMVCCDVELIVGDGLCVYLLIVGDVDVVVCWVFGGWIGCEFDEMILFVEYYGMFLMMLCVGQFDWSSVILVLWLNRYSVVCVV